MHTLEKETKEVGVAKCVNLEVLTDIMLKSILNHITKFLLPVHNAAININPDLVWDHTRLRHMDIKRYKVSSKWMINPKNSLYLKCFALKINHIEED